MPPLNVTYVGDRDDSDVRYLLSVLKLNGYHVAYSDEMVGKDPDSWVAVLRTSTDSNVLQTTWPGDFCPFAWCREAKHKLVFSKSALSLRTQGDILEKADQAAGTAASAV